MPIYEQTYRRFEGRSLHRFRWSVIVEQEFGLIIRQRPILIIGLIGLMHSLLYLMIVVANDVILQNPEKYQAYQMVLRQSSVVQVNERMFYNFLSWQIPLFFIACLQAGSGMICNDVRNNLLELYFSKPISWLDYALGKLLTLVAIGAVFFVFPSFCFLLVHNLLLPGLETLKDSLGYGIDVLAYGALITLPTAFGILAASALIKSQNYAAMTIIMLLFADSGIAVYLSEALHKPNYKLLSFPLALNRVGEELFGIQNRAFNLRWEWSLGVVVLVCLIAAAVVMMKSRRAEVAA